MSTSQSTSKNEPTQKHNNYEPLATNLLIIFDLHIGFPQFIMLPFFISNIYNFIIHIERKFGKERPNIVTQQS